MTELTKKCNTCEYGDYDKQENRDVCCYIVDEEPMRLTGGMHWFISKMGCGRYEPVKEGNPRSYMRKTE